MKKLCTLLGLLACHAAAAQKMSADYFKEAGKYVEAGQYAKAVVEYQQLVATYPKDDLYPLAYYNLGYTYFKQKDYAKAIKLFDTILQTNFNERERLGGGSMDEPYANYKHRASELLSAIYYSRQEYTAALHYFTLATTTYPYLHFCGNEYAANDVHIAVRYADLYQKLHQPQKALAALLPAVFITLADNSAVLAQLKPLLAHRPTAKRELDTALAQLHPKKKQLNGQEYTNYYLTFLGTEITAPQPYQGDGADDPLAIAAAIRKTAFYKMVAQL